MSPHYLQCHRTTSNVTALTPMSPYYLQCHRTNSNVTTLPPMSPHYLQCHRTTSNATALPPMSPHYLQCHRTTSNVTALPPMEEAEGHSWLATRAEVKTTKHGSSSMAYCHKPTALGTSEWWISGLMLDPLFFLISRLNIACCPREFNLRIN